MWILIALILTLARGSFSTSSECRRKVEKECEHLLFPMNFPSNSEELESLCSGMNILAPCVLNALSTCADEEEREYIRKLVNVIRDACNPESEIFQAISKNLQCIKSSAGLLEHCDRPQGIFNAQDNHDLTSFASNFLENEKYPIETTRVCLLALWDAICPSAVIGNRCGLEAENAVLTLLQNFHHNIDKCHEDILAEQSTLKEFIHNALEAENDLQDTFDKKK